MVEAWHCMEDLGSSRVWLGVNLILGELMNEAGQATMTNAPLIIPILNLVPKRGALLTQFRRNVINVDVKKVKGARILFEFHSLFQNEN
jgi:hypothetical protein